MSQTILIITKKDDTFFSQLEESVFKQGFQTLCVQHVAEVLPRLQVEPFAAIVLDTSLIKDPEVFLTAIQSHPLGAVIPLVMIEEPGIERDLLKDQKTILDQTFVRNEISPDGIADYLVETVKQAAKESKKGDLGHVLPPFILQMAHTMGLNGAVSFMKQQERRMVYFENGEIIFATSNRPEDLFGQFLRNKGMVDEQQCQEAAAYAQENGLRIGETFVQKRIIRAEVLFPLLQDHLKSIILPIFSWEEGHYRFLIGEEADQKEIIFKLPVSQLIYEGITQQVRVERIALHLARRGKVLVPNPSLATHLHELMLTNQERDLVVLMSRERTIAELLKLSSLSRQHTLQLILLFVVLGVCHLQAKNSVKKAVAAKPVKASAPAKPRKPATKKETVQETTLLSHPIEDAKPLTAQACVPVFVSDRTPLPSDPVSESKRRLQHGSTPGEFRRGVATGLLWGLLLVAAAQLSWNYYLRQQQPQQSSYGQRLLSQWRQPRQVQYIGVTREAKAMDASSDVVKTATQERQQPQTQAATARVAAAKQKKSPTVVPKPPAPQKKFQQNLSLAKQYYKQGKLKRAMQLATNALAIKPRSGEALVQLANIYYDMDREAKAVSYLEQALKYDSRNADAHLILGNIHLMRGRKASAVRAYRNYLEYGNDAKQGAEVRKVLSKIER